MHAPRQPAPLQRSRGGATAAWLLALALVCAGGLAFLAGGFDALLRSDPVAEKAEADSALATEPMPAARAVGESAPSQGPDAAAPAEGGSPSNDPVYRNNRAVELLEGGELDEAIELFEQVVSEAPENETYRANLRNALLRRANELTGSDPDAAAADYERALELAADDATRERIAGLRDRARAIASEEKDFVVESTLHFTFRFDGAREEIIGGVDELKVILEAAYQEYGEIFRRRPVEEGEPRIEVVLYRSEGFNAVTGLGDWAGGVFDGTIRVPADDLRDRGRVARLRSVLRHEVAHAFTASIGAEAASKAKASHILMKDEAALNTVKDQIAGGASFADMAKEHSTCPSGKSGGDLGSFGPGQMVKEFNDVVFGDDYAVGDVHGPIKTQFGYHLILITERS